MFTRISLLLVLGFALTLNACGGSSVSSEDTLGENQIDQDQVLWPDTDATEKENVQPAACQSDAECTQKMATAPACKAWKCDTAANACVLSDLGNGVNCDDHNKCTENDKCLNGVCLGAGVNCDDKNACTDDKCDPNMGCTHADATTPCNDGDMCTADDHCQGGQCTGDADPKCNCNADAECAPYDDGDKCNGVMACVEKQCVPKPGSAVDCSGVVLGACEEVKCDATSGECKKRFKPDNVECTDGSFCTINDKCVGGQCVGTNLVCEDNNPCTDDSCDKASGCVHKNADTKTCDDGKLCTTGDTCKDGVCKGVINPECACDSDTACKPFDDGDLCNGTMKCVNGGCENDPLTAIKCTASAGGQCQEVYCETTTGQCQVKMALDGTKCDDKDACTGDGVCKAGTCVVTTIDCNDKNACTKDGCDKATGCTHTNVEGSCGDGNSCTTDDKCVGGVCVGTPDASCQCVANKDCKDDGDKCNGVPACVDGQCVVSPSSVVTCPVAVGCDLYLCKPETGVCEKTVGADGILCDDGDLCTEKDTCAAGVCKAGTPVVCDDQNLCTDDACDPKAGCTHAYNTLACDDGNTCSTNDKCVNGTCKGLPAADCKCETDDQCAAYDDGNLCNGKVVCVENKCVVDATTTVECPVADPNGCKLSYCEPAGGACVTPNLPDGKPCDDLDSCNLVDTCKDGACAGSGSVICNDDNACTDDTCDPATGCVFAFNEAACDDGDTCTENDLCGNGVCQPGENVCGPTCAPDWTVTCGSTDTWDTTYPGATSNVTAYACNAADTYDGPEYTYRFTAPYSGTVNVYLTQEDVETDILVLDDLGAGCKADNCKTWDYSAVSIPMVAGASLYFVVDGYNGAAGGYTLHVDCVPDREVNCADGIDEDQDGTIDCDDTDCQGTADCPLPECKPDWTLTCGSTDTWWNYGSDSTNVLTSYSCNKYAYPGPEYTYTFTAAEDGDVTITLTDEEAELDVMVLDADETGKCLPGACADGNWDMSELTFAAVKGHTYYLVVDGWEGAESQFTITVTCGTVSEVEAICDDDGDNDGDGLTDCDDPDCATAGNCVTATETSCTDGVDNDNDGFLDCLDPDCAASAFCPTCTAAETLACGDLVTGSNDAAGSTNVADYYSCAEWDYFGPEYAYTFTPANDGTVTIELAQDNYDYYNDLDVIVLETAGTGDNVCNPAACIAYDLETVSFDVKGGKTYYVIVDGWNFSVDSYLLSVTCQ